MTDQYSGNNSGVLTSDLNSQNQGQGPTQGQGQRQQNVDPTNHVNIAAPETRDEGRGPTQRHEQGGERRDPITHSSHGGQDPTQGRGQYNVDPTNLKNIAASETRSEGRDPTQRQGQGEERHDPITRSFHQGQGLAQGQGQNNVDPTHRENIVASENHSGDRGPTQRQGQGEERHDPIIRSSHKGQDPTQGQGQHNVDPANRENIVASETHSEGRGPTQRQGQGEERHDPINRSSHPASRLGCGPHQATNQSADPDFGRHDPARGRPDDQIRSSGPGGGHECGHPDQQDQRRQGKQTAGENVPHGDISRDPRHGGHKEQVVSGPQERIDAGNYGTSTGTGPGSRPGNQEIHGDGGFGGKPPFPERVIGTAEMIIGKATGNVKMYEHGQQHKAQGY